MATMISEVYDALLAAGAPQDKARKAAEVLASYDPQFADVRADLKVLKGALGANTAMVATLLRRSSASDRSPTRGTAILAQLKVL
jgi:hypothetical protein